MKKFLTIIALAAFGASTAIKAEVTVQTALTQAQRLLQMYNELPAEQKLRAGTVLRDLSGLIGERIEAGAPAATDKVVEVLKAKLQDPAVAEKVVDLFKQQGPLFAQIQQFMDNSKGLIDRAQWLLGKLVTAYSWTPGFLAKPIQQALDKINAAVQGAQAVKGAFDNKWVQLIIGKLRDNPELRERVLPMVTQLAEGALGIKAGGWLSRVLGGEAAQPQVAK